VFSLWGCGGSLRYEIRDAEVTITDCEEASKGDLEIPTEFKGLAVTSIGFEAFFNCDSLTSITIPQAFHSEDEASRLGLDELWPKGFSLP